MIIIAFAPSNSIIHYCDRLGVMKFNEFLDGAKMSTLVVNIPVLAIASVMTRGCTEKFNSVCMSATLRS